MSTRASIFDALNNNDVLTINSLVKSGTCDVNSRSIDGSSPLHIAVNKGNTESVMCLLGQSECDVNSQDSDGDTPIHIAVQNSNIEIIMCLLGRTDCDVDKQDNGGDTPLHIAVQKRNLEIVMCLLGQSECDVTLQNKRGNTPLHTAVLYSNIAMIRYLFILKGTNCGVTSKNKLGDTPLHTAVLYNHIEIVRCFLINLSDCGVNIQNSRGDTPLHIAVSYGHLEIVRCLINQKDCSYNIQNNRAKTPLDLAVLNNNVEIVRCLISCTEFVKGNLDNIYVVLRSAVQESKIDIVRCFIEEGGLDVNKKLLGCSIFSSPSGLQTLHNLAKYRKVEWIHVLSRLNVDVLTNHVENKLQLVEFILKQNDFQSLCFFIHNDLYINCLTSSGENIVHLLAKFYMDYLHRDFSFLFGKGLDFNLMNYRSNSPLMVASLLNNLPFIQFLALNCDVKRQNNRGHTALHLCVIGFTLIKEKITPYSTKHCTAEYYPRYMECIDTLLNLGLDVNMQDKRGKTVLMLACIKNDSYLVQKLIICGADVNIVDIHGRTALQHIDLTNKIYDVRCFNLLLSRGCKQSLNQPCLNGNTFIQNALKFTSLWQRDHIIHLIKFLVFQNVNLQFLTSDQAISHGQLSLSSKSMSDIRQLLYLSGGSFVQITQILNFEAEEAHEEALPETLRENPREKFYLFANNLSLQDICRRVIRQSTGLEIHNRISELIDISILQNFLMFKDDSEEFSLPIQLESFDDDYDDDYDSYDLNFENDDFKNGYFVYKDYIYLNTVHAGLKERISYFESDSDSDLESNSDSDLGSNPDSVLESNSDSDLESNSD